MSGLFRLAYACSVGVVFLMCVIFGAHALLDEDSDDYYRLVFVTSGLVGIAGILAGTAIFRRQLPMAAGLAMGGIGAITFGWIERENGPDTPATSLTPCDRLVARTLAPGCLFRGVLLQERRYLVGQILGLLRRASGEHGQHDDVQLLRMCPAENILRAVADIDHRYVGLDAGSQLRE